MTCLTPQLRFDTVTKRSVTPDSLVTGVINFEMDGVSELSNFSATHPKLAMLKYVPDPTFEKFEDNLRLFNQDETYLHIQVGLCVVVMV